MKTGRIEVNKKTRRTKIKKKDANLYKLDEKVTR